MKISAVSIAAGLFFAFVGGAAQAAPAALVEDVAGTTAVQALDYASEGQVIDLGKAGRLTLGYLSSCVHEEITGGRVTIGSKESKIENGQVKRSKTICDGGRLVLAANQAVQSGATAVRNVELRAEPSVAVYDTSPLITLPKSGRVVIKRIDMPGERHTIMASETGGPAMRLDLASENIALAPGGVYMVSVGGLAQTFRIATEAKRGEVSTLARLVPF